MKKIFFALITSLVLVGCNTNTEVEEPKDYRLDFIGTYTFSGDRTTIYSITTSKGTVTDTKEDTFVDKTMRIKLDPTDSKKLIVEWNYYPNTTGTLINSYGMSLEETSTSFIDDGSLLIKGGLVYTETSYLETAVLKNGVLTFIVQTALTEINPNNNATLTIISVDRNTVIKK